LTLDQLAELSGVNRGTIHRIELNQVAPRLDTLDLLCRALGIDLRAFFQEAFEPASDAATDQEGHSSVERQEDFRAFEGTMGFRRGALDWLEHLEALIHGSADGFTVTSPEGLIHYESQQAIRLLRGAAPGRRSQPWYSHAHPEDLPALAACAKDILALPGGTLRIEFRVPAGPGAWRWVRSSLRNQLDHPALQGIVINTEDIGDWKVAEEQRRRIERLESQLELMGPLTAEFSDLWMGVQGHLDISRLNGVEDQRLSDLQHTLSRASRLLHQMRDICGHPLLDRKPLDLNQLIREQVEACTLVPAGLQHRLDLTLTDPLPGVNGDSDLLRRLVSHLVAHVSDSLAGRAGDIRLATYTTDLSQEQVDQRFKVQGLQRAGAFVILEILDPAGSLASDPELVDLDLTGDPGLSGNGLSLPAAFRTVWAHGGAVEVKKLAQESRIRVLLPVAAMAGSAVEAAPRARGILILDDDGFQLEAASLLLTQLGFAVWTAAGGEEALERLRREGPSIGLILLDVNMPGMNGADTYQAIRKVDPLVKVILCTGIASTTIREEWSDVGLAGILRKPYTFQALKELLQTHMPGGTLAVNQR
jgi:CheY-like chemotaxis protein/transcriptional regulator with XRE-family HTH domain